MVSANDSSRIPLASAAFGSCQPTRSKAASTISATVAAHARNGTITAGANQFSFATYCSKGAHPPHATPAEPGALHNPNHLATADKKLAATAIRKNHSANNKPHYSLRDLTLRNWHKQWKKRFQVIKGNSFSITRTCSCFTNC